jgi:sec-independent protein translocase protein TatC
MHDFLKEETPTLGNHLEDTKALLIRVVVTVFIGVIVCFLFKDAVFNYILEPIRGIDVLKNGKDDTLLLTFHDVSSPLTFQFDMVLLAAIIVTSPVLVFWLWQFVKPALKANEIKFANVYLVISLLLTGAAALYAHNLVLPTSVRFFTSLNQNEALKNTQFSVDAFAYLDYFRTLFLATLITFQLPIVLFTLLKTRLLPHSFISQNRKYIYFFLSLSLFILIPGDVTISILILAPIVVLMEIAILLGGTHSRKKTHRFSDESIYDR